MGAFSMMTGSRLRNPARPYSAQNRANVRLDMVSKIFSKWSPDRDEELSRFANLTDSGRFSETIISGKNHEDVMSGCFFEPDDTTMFKMSDGVSLCGSEASRP
jgi:hypothetical protein